MTHMTVRLRNAKPRPVKGTAAKARRARRSKIERVERLAKCNAIIRDSGLCRRCGTGWPDEIEVAHITDKGMGGDHGLVSSKASDFLTLCRSCHQGPRSIHSGHVVIECGPARGDGPVTFREKRIA